MNFFWMSQYEGQDSIWDFSFACNKLAKIKNLGETFSGPRYHPLVHLSFKYYHQKSVHNGFVPSQAAPIFGPET